jgi:L-iditol 2-dehydrogenase
MVASLPKTMLVSVLLGRLQMEVQEVPVPDVPPGGILIRVRSVGICGSDVVKIRTTSSQAPRVIGHEVAGEVVFADQWGTHGFNKGDRVVVGHVHIPCMHCTYCRHGSLAMCKSFKASHIEPGGYAQYVALSSDHTAHSVLAIPEGLSYDEATFVDPVACCLRAISRSEVTALDRVGVMGAGTMGGLFLQILRQLQTETFAIEVSPTRLLAAQRFGAEHMVAASGIDVAGEVLRHSDGEGLDAVILTVVSQETLELALSIVRDGGILCLFAAPMTGDPLRVDPYQLFRRELSVRSSYSASLVDIGNALRWIHSRKVNVAGMITGECDLQGILPAVLAMDDLTYKVILHP